MREATIEESEAIGRKVALTAFGSTIASAILFVLVLDVIGLVTAFASTLVLAFAYVTCVLINLLVISSSTLLELERLAAMLKSDDQEPK